MFSSDIYDFRIKINTTILSWINNLLRVVVSHMNGLADDTSHKQQHENTKEFLHIIDRVSLPSFAYKNVHAMADFWFRERKQEQVSLRIWMA